MAQNKKQYQEFNCETGETTVRDFTAEELAAYKLDEELTAQQEIQAKAKEAAKAALLTRLGITAEEAQLLLGGN
jgi:hypothetical protein